MLLNQLREITGIQDPSFLHEALKVGFQSQLSRQALKQLSTSQVCHFYTWPEHRNRRNPTGQMVSFLNREMLRRWWELTAGEAYGNPVIMCFVCVDLVWTLSANKKTKKYSSREVGCSSGVMLLFVSIAGYNLKRYILNVTQGNGKTLSFRLASRCRQ